MSRGLFPAKSRPFYCVECMGKRRSRRMAYCCAPFDPAEREAFDTRQRERLSTFLRDQGLNGAADILDAGEKR